MTIISVTRSTREGKLTIAFGDGTVVDYFSAGEMPEALLSYAEDFSFTPTTPTAEQIKANIQAEITALETAQLLPRVTREALMLTAVLLAAQQGVAEPQLYAENIAYRKMKDFDTMIAQLRSQL